MKHDTKHFIQLYKCKTCGRYFDEHHVMVVKTRCGEKIQKCPNPACHSENIRCVGDTRGII